MAKAEYLFEDFLKEVHPEHHEFVAQLNDFLVPEKCSMKIELAKSGYVLSYVHKKTKKVIANYVFRKSGMLVRIYGESVNKYNEFLNSLPDEMINAIEKASVCKRMLDPASCNSRCSMGYDFTVKGDRYQKCKYGSFMFLINHNSIPFIKEFIENEVRAREAA